MADLAAPLKWHPDWHTILGRLEQIAYRIREDGYAGRSIYGVPRGGCVPAAWLAADLGVDLLDSPAPGAIVVDDLVDSGVTKNRYMAGGPFYALYRKSWSPDALGAERVPKDAWVIFPWESIETPAVDAVLRLLQKGGLDTSDGLVQHVAETMVPKMIEITSALYEGYALDFPRSH